uniref:Uncharacterized protein n=1 Tax=Glossina pallidipes TaxID=7398 RepID=A0A1B0AG72_GLOPL
MTIANRSYSSDRLVFVPILILYCLPPLYLGAKVTVLLGLHTQLSENRNELDYYYGINNFRKQ